MNCRILIFRILLLLYLTPAIRSYGQSWVAGVPFILEGNSISGNGIGMVRASVDNGSALMATFNPGLLGVQSFHQRFNSEIYSKHTPYAPSGIFGDQFTNAFAITAGDRITFEDESMPPFSIGAGYSLTYFDLGTFIVTSEAGPEPVGSFRGTERMDAVTLSAAIQYFATIGFGINFKRIESNLSPFGTSSVDGTVTATPLAFDLGTFIDIPLIHPSFLPSLTDFPIRPNVSTSLAYVYGNIGQDVRYIDDAQADPLPREITAGFSINAGLETEFNDATITLAGFQLVREAENVAVRRAQNGAVSFGYGFEDISIYDNLIAGKASVHSTLRKGFEFHILNLITFRSGSNATEGRPFLTTEGVSVNISEFFRYLQLLYPPTVSGSVLEYVTSHIGITYAESKFSGSDFRSGRMYHGFMISIR